MPGKKGTLTVRVVGDSKPFEKTMGGLGKTAKVGFAAVGGAAVIGGGLAAKGFFDAMDQEATTDQFAASLGLTEKEAKELGEVSGNLYAGAWGDSFSQVSNAVATVRSELGQLGTEDLEDVTANALDFAKAFEQDVNESIGAAGILLRNGLVEDGEEAFDLLTATMQKVPRTARDEVLAATEEYSTFFADLGLRGRDAFNLIATAAQKGGSFGVDKVGDALKELTIRSTDMSSASVAAYEAAGLSADDMAARFAAGGDEASFALSELARGLEGIEDPVKRSNAAIALFGSPLEDLSASELPEFLDMLSMGTDALGNFEGAADKMGDQLNDNVKTKLEAFKRQGMQRLTEFMGRVAIPAFERFAPVVEAVFGRVRDAAGTVVDAFQYLFGNEEDNVIAFGEDIAETFGISQEAAEKFGDIILDVVDVIGDAIDTAIDVFGDMREQLSDSSTRVGRIVQRLSRVFSAAFNAISAVVSTYVKIIKDLWSRFGDDILKYIRITWDNILQVVDGALQAVEGVFDVFAGIFTGDWEKVWEGVKKIFGGIWDAIGGIIKQAVNYINTVIQVGLGLVSAAWSTGWHAINTLTRDIWGKINRVVKTAARVMLAGVTGGLSEVAFWVHRHWDDIVSFVGGLPSRIGAATSGMWNGITDAFRSAINSVIAIWNRLRFPRASFDIPKVHVPGTNIDLGGGTFSVGGWGMPQIPYLAKGGLLNSPTLAMMAEYPGVRSNPEAVAPVNTLKQYIREAVEDSTAGPRVINLVVDGRVLASVVNDHNASRARRNGSRR